MVRHHSSEYEKYLRSKEWAAKRKEAFAYYGKRCARCGSTYRLQVHHKNYWRLGHELMEDLEVVCSRCHKLEHGPRRKRKGLVFQPRSK